MDDDVQRQSDTDEVGELVVSDTLYNQVGLIAYRSRETGRSSHADYHKEWHGVHSQLLRQRERKREGESGCGIIGDQFRKDIGDDKQYSQQDIRTMAAAQLDDVTRQQVGYSGIFHGFADSESTSDGNQDIP